MTLRIGTMSINIHVNFTNYGSALQTWALHRAINSLGEHEGGAPKWQAVLVDYCPDCLLGKDPLNPMEYMWDADEDSRRQCELSLPAIRENAEKFDDFYHNSLVCTKGSHTSENFDSIAVDDGIDAFVCGSDTIFSPEEFGGFEDGYYANYPCMKGRSVAYAPSFGDPHFKERDWLALDYRLSNFLAVGLREDLMIPYVRENTRVPVQRVVDPTLLLTASDYSSITAPVQEEGDYLLLYSRRYNADMEAYADRFAKEHGWKVVEISLRAENVSKHRMFYEAGVEEFLSLVKHARFLVTNSFHGMIFGYHFKTPFYAFCREQANSKISECLDLMGLSDRFVVDPSLLTGDPLVVDWEGASNLIAAARRDSLKFLDMELDLLADAVGNA